MIMVVAKARFCQIVCKLAVGKRRLSAAEICAGLIQGQGICGSKHSDIWQDRRIIFGMAVTVGRYIYDQGNMEGRD